MLVESSPEPLARARNHQGKRALAALLREHGAFSTTHAADVALDICDALAIAHATGVVHGQLGLRCVRLTITRDAGPRDVAIFTLNADGDSDAALDAAPFLAPEQRDLSQAVDARADVWALGALLYTMLLGVAPPPGPVAVRPESMPSSLASVIEACLATDPAARPQDVDELTEKIASFASWPPDRFARLAERRERRAGAERARLALVARGLENMPSVLDKLDDAALARAQREGTPEMATMSSILERPTSRAALDRLMAVVHQGTEAARVELAAELPALVDFDDDDDDVLPTIVREEPSALASVESPLTTAPMFLPPLASQQLSPAPVAPPRGLPVAVVVLATVVMSLGVGYVGYALSAASSTSSPAPPAAAARPAETAASLPASMTPRAAVIPLFVPSALPEVAPVTPASLPDVKP